MKPQKTRRLAAIMFTDIVGYTALMQKDELAASKARALHRQVFDQQHDLHQGEILQYFGDGTLSVFQSAVEAVECAITIQQQLKQEDPVPIRIGLHLGDIVFDGTEIYGDGVNLAARVESMGVAGGILLTKAINEEVKNQQHISTTSLGQFGLKNIANPVEVFSVTNDNITVPARSELKGKQSNPSKSIAVLPFVNMSADKDNEFFSDGMTEEIINALAKIKNLKVTSRTSSFFFKNKNIPIPKIGKELNVSTILEGSIRLSGNNVRITAQLINVEDDTHFWSETFDRSMENIFEVQDEISLLIADKLREHLGHFDIDDSLVAAPKVPLGVYKRYLKGRYHLLKMNISDVKKGIPIMESIIEEQPEFPLPYLSVHFGYTFMGTTGTLPALEAFAKGKPFLDKAIELDKDLPECQYQLAGISFWQNWDLKGSYRHLNKAIEMRPAYAEAHQSMAPMLAAERKFEAGLIYINKALQLDPFSPINHYLKGLIFYLQEEHEKAILCFEKSAELDPAFTLCKCLWGGSLALMGRTTEALDIFNNLPEDIHGNVAKLGGTTLGYAVQGDIEKADAGIVKLEAALQTDSMGSAMLFLILITAILDRHETTLQLIEQGIQHRLPMMVMLYSEPVLKPLRSNPRFQKLMEQILGKEHTTAFSKKKYKTSLLKDEETEKHHTQLKEYMRLEKPHLNPELNLRQLAKLINMHPNGLSQLLNERVGKNFNEFINHYRVDAFKEIAADPKNAHLTLIALAYESGFNSKTVFNTYFKKETGMTPKSWMKEAVN